MALCYVLACCCATLLGSIFLYYVLLVVGLGDVETHLTLVHCCVFVTVIFEGLLGLRRTCLVVIGLYAQTALLVYILSHLMSRRTVVFGMFSDICHVEPRSVAQLVIGADLCEVGPWSMMLGACFTLHALRSLTTLDVLLSLGLTLLSLPLLLLAVCRHQPSIVDFIEFYFRKILC